MANYVCFWSSYTGSKKNGHSKVTLANTVCVCMLGFSLTNQTKRNQTNWAFAIIRNNFWNSQFKQTNKQKKKTLKQTIQIALDLLLSQQQQNYTRLYQKKKPIWVKNTPSVKDSNFMQAGRHVLVISHLKLIEIRLMLDMTCQQVINNKFYLKIHVVKANYEKKNIKKLINMALKNKLNMRSMKKYE